MNKTRKNVHVVPRTNGWAIKVAGNKSASVVKRTKQEAIKVAETIAKKNKADTKIHNKNGKISSGNSYGNDPYPPRDRK